MALHRSDVRHHARLISLIRLLLLAVALAVLTFSLGEDAATHRLWDAALTRLKILLIAVAGLATLLVVTVPWVTRTWQLILHLVFDLVWIGWVIFLSGGVGGPAVPLLFAVVLTSNLVLPGAAPFVVPAVAGLVLATVATLYLAGRTPFPDATLIGAHPLLDPPRIIGNLAIQVGALFLVDLLAQILARRLSEQRLLLGDLIEQLGEGVVVIDRRGDILYANDLVQTLLDLPVPLVIGESLAAVLEHPQLSDLGELFATPDLPTLGRVRVGDDRLLTVRVNHLRGRGGAIIGRTLVLADETRLHRLEEEALRSERLAEMGRMAAGIAHEVRNPLASLRGCAQELGDLAVQAGSEEARPLAAIVLSEADRLEGIVGEFLALARPREPDPRPVALDPLLAELETLVGKRSDLPADLRLRVAVADGTPEVAADPGQIRQVLLNLVANALDAVAATEAPEVVIEAQPADAERVRLTVIDNGSGIEPEDLARVFTPFHSGKSQGTGLGLTVVERIVARHGGHVELSSVPGAGTRVTLLWPVAGVRRG